jgi:predicted dehydrogenase
MDTIMDIANRHNLIVVEDAAQGVISTYKGRGLGSIGDYGCYSFHETKNYSMGEGGALLINQAIHTLDLMRYFANSAVESVRATVSHHGDTAAEVEDTAEGVVRFESGARGLFYFTINNDCDDAIRLDLTCEGARIESRAGYCNIFYKDGREVRIKGAEGPQFCGAKSCYGSSHTIQIHDFYHDPDGSRARWMAEEALKTQSLVDAIFAASNGVHA